MKITHPKKEISGIAHLPSSKSESNRALIIQALSENKIELENLSEARDTQTMIRLLKSAERKLDVLDAGTTMRFLIAYTTVKNRESILTGTERMQQRPVKILVDALQHLGADIKYLNNEGYPPIEILGFTQKNEQVEIRGDVSSQYISALLMVAPLLEKGLKLKLLGTVYSKPYISMTLQLMNQFGIETNWNEDIIEIEKQNYQSGNYKIESDWSGASYWYSIVALAEKAELTLTGLKEESWQGDSAIIKIMEKLGVKTEFTDKGTVLSKIPVKGEYFEYDFISCPDLAQTIAVVCAAKGINAKFTSLKSLRIKETDRIAALEKELTKFGSKIKSVGDDEILIEKSDFKVNGQQVNTYEDHRMGMAFAPLALLGEIDIEDPEVVNKSYPSYWRELKKVGFEF